MACKSTKTTHCVYFSGRDAQFYAGRLLVQASVWTLFDVSCYIKAKSQSSVSDCDFEQRKAFVSRRTRLPDIQRSFLSVPEDSFTTDSSIFSLNSVSVISSPTRHGTRRGRYSIPASAPLAAIFLLCPFALLLQRYCICHTSSPPILHLNYKVC